MKFLWIAILLFHLGNVYPADNPEQMYERAWNVVKSNENLTDAIEELNKLLMLPSNEYTPLAQELIGVAYQLGDNTDKAIAEYKVYLALYPNGPAADRISRRLTALQSISAVVARAEKEDAKPSRKRRRNITVSESTYLYDNTYGKATLINNLKVNAHFDDDGFKNLTSLRMSRVNDVDHVRQGPSKVSLLFHDLETPSYGFRIGRQNPTVGIMSRFDGASVRLKPLPGHTLTLATGDPFVGYSDSARRVYHISHERIRNGSSITGYINKQTVDGLVERNALGLEYRYFSPNVNFATTAEYDLSYRAYTSMSAQVSYYEQDISVYSLFDRRRSPILFMEPALALGLNTNLGRSYTSVAELLRYRVSSDDLYSLVKDASGTSTIAVLGMQYAFSKSWRVAMDVQLFQLTGSTSLSDFSNYSGSKARALNVQLYNGDLFGLILNHTRSETIQSRVINLINTTTIGSVKFFTSFRWYYQYTANQRIVTYTPIIRVIYKMDEELSFEGQYSIDRIHTTDYYYQTIDTTTNPVFFVGVRVDF